MHVIHGGSDTVLDSATFRLLYCTDFKSKLIKDLLNLLVCIHNILKVAPSVISCIQIFSFCNNKWRFCTR